jgi:uncharacterized cupin superfamily protein
VQSLPDLPDELEKVNEITVIRLLIWRRKERSLSMEIAKLSSVPKQQVTSPKGKYRFVRQSISQALGGIEDTGTWGGGHPFDVEYVRLSPGAANFPFHAHAAQWEMYVFISGSGRIRGPENTITITQGDSVIFKPGESHQILNPGVDDLVYYVISDQPQSDVVTYPDTPGKCVINPAFSCFTMTEAPYYEPEE